MRQILSGVFNICSFERFMERPDFAKLHDGILNKANRSDPKERGELVKLNLIALRALYDWAELNDVHGVKERFGQFLFTVEGGIKPFEEAVVFVNSQPYILFLDLRGSNHLSKQGRKFVFSVMHEHIRVQNPDLEDVKLGVLHLTKEGKERHVVLHEHDGGPLFSLGELEVMVRAMFAEIKFTKAA